MPHHILNSKARNIDSFLFGQQDVHLRLSAIRCVLGLIIAVLFTFGPYSRFFVEVAPIFVTSEWTFPAFGEWFPVLRWITVILALAFCIGFWAPIVAILLTLSFGVCNLYVAQFAPKPWSANSHLNIFILLFCFYPWKGTGDRRDSILRFSEIYGSFIIAFIQIYIALFYFQSGFAKLCHVGVTWYLSGQTPLVSAHKIGTDFGKYLTHFPWVFVAAGVGTGVIEFSIPVLLFLPKLRQLTPMLAFSLHMGIFVVLGIPFWHLWALFPVVYSAPLVKRLVPLAQSAFAVTTFSSTRR